MNKTAFTGRLTRDPELKQTTSGISVCTFRLAVKRPRVKDKTDFIDFVAWRNEAEFLCRYFKKGDPVEVAGELHSDEFTDREGNKRQRHVVECKEISFCLTSGNAGAKEQEQETSETPEYESNNVPQFEEVKNDDDLPF